MSNFSNLGFPVTDELQLRHVIEEVYPKSFEKNTPEGTYFHYRDQSGAELWIQVSRKKEIIGVNPHFNGESRLVMRITNQINRCENELDGALHGWLLDENEQQQYPFVFDLPDFFSGVNFNFPALKTVQLTAFAREISFFHDDEDFEASQDTDFKWAAKSFIPTGLFNAENAIATAESLQATAIFTGEVKKLEKRINQQTNDSFYWMLIETLGAAIDVVADKHYFPEEPYVGGTVHGSFWLSGRIISDCADPGPQKGFFDRFFG